MDYGSRVQIREAIAFLSEQIENSLRKVDHTLVVMRFCNSVDITEPPNAKIVIRTAREYKSWHRVWKESKNDTDYEKGGFHIDLGYGLKNERLCFPFAVVAGGRRNIPFKEHPCVDCAVLEQDRFLFITCADPVVSKIVDTLNSSTAFIIQKPTHVVNIINTSWINEEGVGH